MTTQIISKMSHQERIQRRDEKRAEVLKIARRMGWINVEAASELLDVTRPAAARTLKWLDTAGMLCLHEQSGMPKRIWYSISATGIAEAYFLENLPLPSGTLQAGRWKIAPQNYQHEQEVLVFAIKALKAGADVQLFEQSAPGGSKTRAISSKYPDLRVEIDGQVFGIEIEREVKSQRRYRGIVASHWQAIERQQYDGVLYLSPGYSTRDRLGRIVKSVFNRVRIGGRERALTDQERQRFLFGTYSQGISFINNIGEKDNGQGG